MTNFEDITQDEAAFFLCPGLAMWFQITGLNLLCDIWTHRRLFPGIPKCQSTSLLQPIPGCKIIVRLVIKVATQTAHFALEKEMNISTAFNYTMQVRSKLT